MASGPAAKPAPVANQPTDWADVNDWQDVNAGGQGAPAAKPSLIQRIQSGFDNLTTPKGGHDPVTNSLERYGAGAIEGAGSLFVHPVKTMQGVASQVPNLIDPTGTLAHTFGTPTPIDTLKGMAREPARTLGNITGGAVTAEAGMGAANGIGRVGTALRSAAIGDPDAAALQALNVSPKSGRVQSTLNAVDKARPYLKGARDLSDLQSRVSPAKEEIWSPYRQATDAIGNRPVQGPNGMTDVRSLEGERVQTSALNRDLKSKMPNPESVKLAEQKGMGQAQLLQHERNIKSALDPELESTGIKPGAIRSTYGGVSKVGERISGRSTVGEESQPYGLGKLANIDITKPFSAVKPVFQAGRDIVAGRPLFSGKPTDVAVRDAFRYGGPKPDLGRLVPPSMAAARPLGLPSPAIQLGRSPEPGGTPAGYQPPPFYHDTTAMRTGRLLKAPPIELGGRVEGTPPPTFRHDTTPMRQGRLLPEPSRDTPLSSHVDAFPEQRPGSALLRPRKGKR